MLIRLVEAVFAPKYPRHYRGRHRAPARLAPFAAPPAAAAPTA